MEVHPLLRSLLATTPTTAPAPKSLNPNIINNVSGIILRLFFISFIGIVAIWANHEASKGFSITIVNDAGKYSLPGKQFSLFYEANDKATRIVLNTSRFVENLLYPNDHQDKFKRKQINSVTLRLAPIKSPPAIVAVDSRKPYEYVISLSPWILENNNEAAIVLAVLQGMARVWLWDGNGATPPVLLNGMVEYISSLAGFTVSETWTSSGATVSPGNNAICWKDEQPRKVAGFLRYCDQRKQPDGGGGGGVIRRLNERMRNGWHDWMMDDALGMAGQHACASYNMLIRHHHHFGSM